MTSMDTVSLCAGRFDTIKSSLRQVLSFSNRSKLERKQIDGAPANSPGLSSDSVEKEQVMVTRQGRVLQPNISTHSDSPFSSRDGTEQLECGLLQHSDDPRPCLPR
ncbi:hypothetical protein PoB_001434900 [Plakobranchus ocellatus]|uniref:Uncharacterized protein n=1 Tax=Plakobranchus ocellatus TaxID=259542 RepID=A0AAV3Z0A4_9GAST|nr:hypothetical protein PoB_001434900 [Plakobranchus ocellatus]